MKSPKFKFIESNLSDVFTMSLLIDEWKKRFRYQLRKQMIFDAIEYRDYSDSINNICSGVRREILGGTYSVRPARRYLAEKSKGLCRQMTLFHPRDLLVLERLSRSVHYEIKSKSPSSSAFFEPDDGRFVKGLKQADLNYGSFASWKRFQREVFGFAKDNKYIVVTDVANFYDFINFSHLRNIIASLVDIREVVLDLLIHVLNKLTWVPDFMPLSQVGMPQIETTATRVLANAMLFEVDRVCESSAVLNYARFMDDMDVGVDSLSQAKCVVRDIDLTLQSRQLRLNSSKTRILSQPEAFAHFCVKENDELVRIEKLFDAGSHPKLVRRLIEAKYVRWLDRGSKGEPGPQSPFKNGNGSKLHKYTINLVYQAGGSVPDEDLIWLVRNEPGMRSVALRYLSQSRRINYNLYHIMRMIKSGIFVDDASIVDISGYFLHARFRKTLKCEKAMREFCRIAVEKSDIGLHCAIFVSSKFLPHSEIIELIKENESRICGDFWLSRAAAGVAGRFIGSSKYWGPYHDIISRINSEDAHKVLNYILSVASDSKYSISLKSYLTAKNESFPQGVYFPKVLILLAASKNPAIGALLPNMHARHPALKRDPFYNAMGF